MGNTTYTIPNRPTDADTRSIGALLSDFDAVLAGVNNLDGSNVQAGTVLADKLKDADKVGISGASIKRRGKSVITATESGHAPGGYAYMPTFDRVQDIVVPQDALMFILFECLARSTTGSGIEAAIVLDTFKFSTRRVGGYLSGQSGLGANFMNVFNYIVSCPLGLMGNTNDNGVQPDPVTTGEAVGASFLLGDQAAGGAGILKGAQMFVGGPIAPDNQLQTVDGGPCAVWIRPDTYDVGVMFKGNNMEVKQRRLWVWTVNI